jgi:hypothetical protein
MKKILFALAAVAALGASEMTFAQSQTYLTPEAAALVNEVQADKRTVMLQTLALNDKQLAKFTPIYDEYQAEMEKLYTGAINLRNRLFVADYGGMTDAESKDIMAQAFKLREARLDLLKEYAGKLDRELPATKVFQFVQVENKIHALLDVVAAVGIPIVTKTPNTLQ